MRRKKICFIATAGGLLLLFLIAFPITFHLKTKKEKARQSLINSLPAAQNEVSADQAPFGAFSALYGPAALLNIDRAIQIAEDEAAPAMSAIGPFQTKIQDPDNAAKELDRARANCFRALGENAQARLLIPFGAIDVKLLETSIMVKSEYLQSIVDKPDMAAVITKSGWADKVVADHNAQGFSGLLLIQPGAMAYVSYPNGTIIALQCVKIENGYNDGRLRHSGGEILENETSWLFYTCRQDAFHIRLTYWEPVAEYHERML